MPEFASPSLVAVPVAFQFAPAGEFPGALTKAIPLITTFAPLWPKLMASRSVPSLRTRVG